MCVQRASSGGGGGHETRFGLDHPATHPTGGLASRGVRRSRLNFPAPTGFLFGQLPAAPIEPPTWLNLVEALLPKSVMAAMHTTAMSATRRAYSTRLAPRSPSVTLNFAWR